MSPRYPQLNGMAERTIQTAKRILKKASERKEDIHLALLNFLTTSKPGGKSPSELLMNRKVRALLPQITSLPKNVTRPSNRYYRCSNKPLPCLQPGDTVRYRRDNEWHPARIVSQSSTPRSYMLQTTSGKIRRNRRDILRTNEPQHYIEIPPMEDTTLVKQRIPSHTQQEPQGPPPEHRITEYRTRSGRLSKPPNRLGHK